MKKLAVLCTLAALAACGSEQPAPAPTPTPTVAAVVPTGPARDWPGTYEITLPDGSTGNTVIKEDGTYLRTVNNIAEAGTWKDGAPTGEQFCFDPEGELKPNRCYTMEEPGEDGTFKAQPDDGGPVIAKKVS
jgi:hypothetical protein